jgi:PAS domain S-box-containing protein
VATLATESNVPRLLDRIVEIGRELTGARYAALGIFDAEKTCLTHFITVGMDETTKRAIGHLPTGLGLLGFLAKEDRPVRLKDLTQHSASVGFPPHHPQMTSFLGMSIRAHGRLYGRLYLADKQEPDADGSVTEFTALDEALIVVLAAQAGAAIENACLLEQVHTEEDKARLLLEVSGGGIYGLDLEGRCTFINKAGAGLLGYEPGEVIGQRMHDLIHHTRRDGSPYPDDACSIYRAFRTGQACRLDNEVLWRKDRTSFPVEFCSNPIYRDGRLMGAVATFFDVTERTRAEEALRASEERFRQLAESIRQVFWMTDPEKTRMLYVSPAYEEIWGRSCESLYQSPRAWLDAIHPEDRGRVLEAARTRQRTGEYHEEYRIVRPDGSLRWILDRGFPVLDSTGAVYRVAGLAEDVTARKQMEERQGQAQKMEAVGQLVGGIAHDFSNLLTVINGYSEMLLASMETDDPLRSDITEIEKAGHRAATLTHHLLSFSRRQILQQQVLDLGVELADLGTILLRLIGEHISCTFRVAPDLWLIKADPSQVEQVLINLAVNARDAMPTGGDLVIEAANVTLDQVAADRLGLAVADEYVTLAVTDTGVGLDDQVRAHLFEPFFTTKECGKGTGLGLATVHGIVMQSRGAIEVQSESGQGTTVRIYLPRTAECREPGAANQASGGLPGGWETILLVEDDEAVRTLGRAILTSQGYTVVEARDGTEALRIAADYPGPIHLLLTDVVMPKLSGREMAEGFLPLRPETRVLYMSGYTDDTILRHGIMVKAVAFLRKPFSQATLTQKVRALLDGGR